MHHVVEYDSIYKTRNTNAVVCAGLVGSLASLVTALAWRNTIPSRVAPQEAEMYQYYVEAARCLLTTVADGSCGIDTCTMILGWERCPRNWEKVKQMLHEFA